MKALSIKQPWAWLIVNGFKDVENRTWRTKYRGPLLIHASKAKDEHFCKLLDDFSMGSVALTDFLSPTDPHLKRLAQEWPGSKALPTGGIVGRATLAQCLQKSNMEADLQAMETAPVPYVAFHHSPWFDGRFGFVLIDRAPLDFWATAGKLGIFDIPFNGGHDLGKELGKVIDTLNLKQQEAV